MKVTLTNESRRIVANDAIPREKLVAVVQAFGHGKSRDEMADIVEDAPSQMSRLMTGHVKDFSADRLIRMIRRFGADIEIRIGAPKKGRRGKVRVVYPAEV